MAIKYDKNAPSGWGIDDTGHFTKVPTGYVLQNGQYIAPSAGPTATPAPSPTVAPVSVPNTPAPTTPSTDFTTFTGQTKPMAAPDGYQTLSFDDQDPQALMKLKDQYDVISTPYSSGGVIKLAYYGKPIQYNYMVDASGNRKKVRLDDSAGMQAAFAAGYKAESAPGVPTGNADINTAGGAVDQSQMKRATLRKVMPDGSVSRVVVQVGSADAQKYFGAGYTLETAAQAPDVAVTMQAPNGTTTVAPNKAEAQKLMSQGYTPITVAPNTPTTLPASVASRTGNGAMVGVTDINQANAAINADQEKDQASAAKSEEPPVRGGVSLATTTPTTPTVDLNKTLQDLLSGMNRPETPSLVETYGDLKTKYGTDNLETQLNDLNTQLNDVMARKAERIAAEKSKPVDLSLAAGRVSEVEQQENTRITALQNQMQSVQNQLTQKMQTVDTIMKYTQQDYQNATDAYDRQYSNSIQAINLVRGLQQDQKDEAEKVKDDARANLQIIYNSIQSGGTDFDALTAAEKLNITKLEMQAGLPQGFYATLKNKNPKGDVVSTFNTEENGKSYVGVMMRDGDKIWTQKFEVGDAKSSSQNGFELSAAQIADIVNKYENPQEAIDYMRDLYNQNNGGSGSANGLAASLVSALPKIAPTGSVWMRGDKQAPECGQFVNDITGVGVGDSLASKKAIIDPSIKSPQPGDVVVTTDGGTTNGHVAIVKTNSGGKITVVESNYKKKDGVGIITYDREISLSDSRILGFAHPKTSASSGTASVPTPKAKDTSSTDEKAFYDDIAAAQTKLAAGTIVWGQAFDVIKAKYGAPDDVIDKLLNKDKWYQTGAYESTITAKKEAGNAAG
ncbi:MAG: CHAP domain-containing protein [Patescibacteria group bacterium]|nr:CHAP domain-containing protein [Patescibacteria group bacterium]